MIPRATGCTGRWPMAVALAATCALPGTAPQVRAQEAPVGALTLGDAARLAAERSAAALRAGARVEQAEARVREQRAELLPSVDADVARGARTFNTVSFGLDFPTIPGQPPFFDPDGEVVGPVRSSDIRGRLDVPLLDLAALGRRKSVRAGADAARQEASAAEQMAATRAAQAYVAMLRAGAEVSAREQDVSLGEQLVSVAHDLVDAGVGVGIDVTRAEAQLATVRAQLVVARHRADVAALSLRRALALDGESELRLLDELSDERPAPPPGEDEAIASAMSRRGDLRAAQAYREVARESLAAVRAGRLPRLSLAADEGWYGRGFGGMLNTYTWSVKLSVPVFDGLERSARIDESQARARELDYGIEDLEADVAFQVRQAILNLTAAQELADAAAERLRLAELEVSQEEDRVQAGVAGTADLVRAALRLNEARTARLDALAGILAARVALAAATGTVTDLP